MERYFRFWSLDPTYRKIVELVQEKGVPCPDYGKLHRDIRLFEGDVYEFGKVAGRDYPEGSVVLFPNLHGKEEKPTTSFPATLVITTESLERMIELEKKYGLDKIPKKRREVLHHDVSWIA
jgi:hypothetical protein